MTNFYSSMATPASIRTTQAPALRFGNTELGLANKVSLLRTLLPINYVRNINGQISISNMHESTWKDVHPFQKALENFQPGNTEHVQAMQLLIEQVPSDKALRELGDMLSNREPSDTEHSEVYIQLMEKIKTARGALNASMPKYSSQFDTPSEDFYKK